MEQQEEESHPFTPYIPEGAQILMLGTFPPKSDKWSMPFYYPNWINDMWRIMGHIFYCDRNHFCIEAAKSFKLDEIKAFLNERGIGLYDTGSRVIRLKGNASDKYLEISQSIDLNSFLERYPTLHAVVTTGEKAASVVSALTGTELPPMGGRASFMFGGRTVTHYRMPSSSRAYPMKLERKAEYYRQMFVATGVI